MQNHDKPALAPARAILPALLLAVPGLVLAPPACAQSEGDWSGAYVGVDLGYSGGDDEAQEIDGERFYIADLDGLSGAVHLGWQRQLGALVLGLEAQAGYNDGNNSVTEEVTGGTITSGADLGAFGSIAARIGVAPSDDWLLFGKVGAAASELSATTVQTCLTPDLCDGAQSDPESAATSGETSWGLLLGAGVERRLGDQLSARVSYEFTDFGRELALPPVDGPGWEHEVDVHSVRLGLSYRF